MSGEKYSLPEKQLILKLLLNYKVENYGYDLADFIRIKGQRSRARRDVKLVGILNLHWETLTDRVSVENGVASYTVGQSSNEEITNILRRLVNPNAKWVS